jgi:hypothetical protein
LKGNIVHFVLNFLRERNFQILLGNNKSGPRILDTGLLQGSVISVCLFILVTNEIFESINSPVRALMHSGK